jgi:acetyl-CoA synthetase
MKMLRPGKTYKEVYDSFRWNIPEYYNIGVDICDKWASQRYRLALIYEDEKGRTGISGSWAEKTR